MFNIGPGELIAISMVALIVLGPQRLPEAVRTVGRVIGELRRISGGFQDELRNALDDDELRDLQAERSKYRNPPSLPPLPEADDPVPATVVERPEPVTTDLEPDPTATPEPVHLDAPPDAGPEPAAARSGAEQPGPPSGAVEAADPPNDDTGDRDRP